MKSILYILVLILLVCSLSKKVYATFSIVAVDTITGEVGSAGASCIAGSDIIEGIIEGIGAVNTQSFYLPQNQDNADSLLALGLTPDSIIGWLEFNDVGLNSSVRQYGVVTLVGAGASAAFTGFDCFAWRGHHTGPGYSIQGNILLGSEIIDSMEFVFLMTSGPLEEKLMAALEAAKVVGADTRCTGNNKSSISAFIKVVRIGDGGSPYLDEIVATTTGSTDPIDLLRIKFDNWKLAKQADSDSSIVLLDKLNINANAVSTSVIDITPLNLNGVVPTEPISVSVTNSNFGSLSSVVDNGDGTYSVTITSSTIPSQDTITVVVNGASSSVELTTRPVITYFRCGDIDNSFDDPNIADLTYFVNFMFKSGSTPSIMLSVDMNGDGDINIADLTYLVNYMFKSGPAPVCQ